MKPDFPLWLRLLPAGLRAKVARRPRLVGILSNTAWLFSDRILRMGVGVIVIIWMARYLGPEQFGLLNFATAFVALFSAVAVLGLQGVVVRDLVRMPEHASEILGTSFFLQLIGGIVAFIVAVLSIQWLRPDDALSRLIVAILGFAMIFKATETVKYWFESQVRSKYAVWAENGVFLLLAAVRIGLIFLNAPLMAFVWAVFVEAILMSVALLVMYMRNSGLAGKWSVGTHRARLLLKDSWPLLLSGMAIMVYMRIDQVMLGQMLGDDAVGIYTAAARISEVWYFIPITIVASVFPAIIEAKKANESLYLRRLRNLYELMVVLALSLAIPMTFLADWLVMLLFGEAYAPAGLILAVHIWAGVFVFLGVASGKWFLVENLQKFVFYRTVAGAIVNVGLNYFMIPIYGAVGAAIATVISQATASVLFNVVNERTRPVFYMLCKSFLLRGLLKYRWADVQK